MSDTTPLLKDPDFIADLDNRDLPERVIADRWHISRSTVNKYRNRDTNTPDDPDMTGRLELGPDGGSFDGIKTDRPITDWTEVFTRFNLDPDHFDIIGDTVRMSVWQQSKRTDSGDRDVVDLYSYKAQFTRKREAIDLPALYAEAARGTFTPIVQEVGQRTVVVAWADIQTGKVGSGGDTAALLDRLNQKRQALADYLDLIRPDHIVIADVGDIVEGFDNVGSQVRTNDLSLMDQVDVAATEFWKAIRLCASFAPTDVLSIPSNHAQWRAKGSKDLMGKPTDDWGLHISKRLEHLSAEVGLPVTFHRPDDWDETLVFDVRGTRLGLVHGHQANSPDRIGTWWEKMTHGNVMDADVLLTGHFHHLRIEPHGRSPRTGKARWHLQAPTLDNSSDWVRNKFGEDGDPGLLVFGIDDNGLNLSALSIL